MVYVYILKLEKDKYYVGKTADPDSRFEKHFGGMGSVWTRKYKPIRVEQLIPNCDDYDEDKYTIICMKNYGIDNVRGGSFVEETLNAESREIITRMINGANNKCFKCGGDHFIDACASDTQVSGGISSYVSSLWSNITKFFGEDPKPGHYAKCYSTKISCYRCGRPGHYSSDCYAKRDIQGHYLN